MYTKNSHTHTQAPQCTPDSVNSLGGMQQIYKLQFPGMSFKLFLIYNDSGIFVNSEIIFKYELITMLHNTMILLCSL